MEGELDFSILNNVEPERPYSEIIYSLTTIDGDKKGLTAPKRMLSMFKYIVIAEDKKQFKTDAIRLVALINRIYGVDFSEFLVKEDLLND